MFLDKVKQSFTLFFCNFLGIVDSRQFNAFRQNHRCRDNRACQWAASRLVNTAHGRKAFGADFGFFFHREENRLLAFSHSPAPPRTHPVSPA